MTTIKHKPAPSRCRHHNAYWPSWTLVPLAGHDAGIVWCRDCRRIVRVKR